MDSSTESSSSSDSDTDSSSSDTDEDNYHHHRRRGGRSRRRRDPRWASSSFAGPQSFVFGAFAHCLSELGVTFPSLMLPRVIMLNVSAVLVVSVRVDPNLKILS